MKPLPHPMRRPSSIALLYVALTCVTWWPGLTHAVPPDAADNDPVEVILLHTNDLHFDFNHLEHVTAAVEHFREHHPNVFLLDAGDVLVRNPGSWPGQDIGFYRRRGLQLIGEMNRLGYDAMTLGNHELHYFDQVTRDVLRAARFPLLGANVEVETPDFDAPQPHVTLETECGLAIAVLGISGGGFGDRPGISLTAADEVLRQQLAPLKDKHQVLVLLTHVGALRDFAIAARFRDADVIIGGHTNTQLNPAPTVNGVLVAQTGGHPHPVDETRRQHLGVIRLLIENERVIEKTGQVLTFDGGEAVLEELTSGRIFDWSPAGQPDKTSAPSPQETTP